MNGFIFSLLALVSTGFITTHAHAYPATCTNLNGVYQTTEGNPTLLTIQQTGCQYSQFLWSNPASPDTGLGKDYGFDGVTYMTSNTADQTVYESSSINDKEMLANVEFYQKAKKKSYTAISHFFLDANNDLHGEYDYYDYDGRLYMQQKPMFKRLK